MGTYEVTVRVKADSAFGILNVLQAGIDPADVININALDGEARRALRQARELLS